MLKTIRKLRADEILVRIEDIDRNTNLGTIVLYKDARCDQRILDETYGLKWKRKHELIGSQNYCTISVWDEEIKQWIERQDVGRPQNFEREKSAASDAFKRAAFNFGIGRELYTTPKDARIILSPKEYELDRNGMPFLSRTVDFRIAEIDYEEDHISKLVVIDQTGTVRYMFPYKQPTADQSRTSASSQQSQNKVQNITLQVIPPNPPMAPGLKHKN